jgi:hypothetical protein
VEGAGEAAEVVEHEALLRRLVLWTPTTSARIEIGQFAHILVHEDPWGHSAILSLSVNGAIRRNSFSRQKVFPDFRTPSHTSV